MALEAGLAAGNSPCFLQAQARTYGQDEQELAEGLVCRSECGCIDSVNSEERGQWMPQEGRKQG